MPQRKSLEDRLWDNITLVENEADEDACWEWNGAYSKHIPVLKVRYGEKTNTVMARRMVYERTIGPLSKDDRVFLICGNPLCVRHVATHRQECSKGHPLSGENLILVKRGLATMRRCRICHTKGARMGGIVSASPWAALDKIFKERARPEFHDRAACAFVPKKNAPPAEAEEAKREHVSLWFPLKDTLPEKVRQAQRICSDCPVRVECLEWALENDEREGIRGGLLFSDRKRLAGLSAKEMIVAMPDPADGMRMCRKCKQEKPLDHFPRWHHTSAKRSTRCYLCRDGQEWRRNDDD